MTDTVLQAFCERCGTRYTSSAPEPPPVVESGKSRLGLFGRRGQDQQAEEERPAVSNASPSSDAFAGTFHFCMDCRQYVCTKCWNNDAGGCLTDRPPQRAGETASSGSAMRRPFTTAGADTLPWKAGARSVPASSDGVELDEWGRPRKKEQAAPTEDVPRPALEAELDPWRGVVFTDEERGASSPAPAETTDAAAAPNLDLRSESSPTVPPEAWPEVDRPQEPAQDRAETAPVWPHTDRPQQPEPEAEREPEPEVAPAEPEPELEPVIAAVELESESFAAEEPEPVPQAEPGPEPEPVAADEPEPVPEIAAVEPESEPVPAAEPEPVPSRARAGT